MKMKMETPHRRGRRKVVLPCSIIEILRLSVREEEKSTYGIVLGLLTGTSRARGARTGRGEDYSSRFLSSCMSRTYLPVVDTTLLFASVPDRLGASRKDNYDRDVRADHSDPRSLPRSRGLGHRACINHKAVVGYSNWSIKMRSSVYSEGNR